MNSNVDKVRAWVAKKRRRHDESRFLRDLATKNGCTLHVRRTTAAVNRGSQTIRIASSNLTYAQDLIRNFDYYFDVVEPVREGSRLVVDYSATRLHTMKEDGLQFWFPELAESMETTRLYLERPDLSPGNVVLDLGAYAGGAAFHFSRAVGDSGRVLAFEPDPRSYECLVRNIRAHALQNVVADRRGVWARTGQMLFQSEGNMGSAIVDAADRDSDERRWIDVVSLEDVCTEYGLDRIDFIKMDVEGSEVPILEGAAGVLRRFSPSLMIEVHFVRGVRTDDEVTRLLRTAGYRVELLDQAGLPLPLIFAQPA